jgi:hypothetical protein
LDIYFNITKVGAFLLFPDDRTETAFRGELRDGDHAEQHPSTYQEQSLNFDEDD